MLVLPEEQVLDGISTDQPERSGASSVPVSNMTTRSWTPDVPAPVTSRDKARFHMLTLRLLGLSLDSNVPAIAIANVSSYQRRKPSVVTLEAIIIADLVPYTWDMRACLVTNISSVRAYVMYCGDSAY